MGKKERDFAERLGIKVVDFSDIVNYIRKELERHKGYFYEKDSPNLMLLQFLQIRKLLSKQ